MTSDSSIHKLQVEHLACVDGLIEMHITYWYHTPYRSQRIQFDASVQVVMILSLQL